ncbi:MAG: ribbon-helix-helix protein, CopG family [Saccharolobus sp.]|uniref:ribbon-helix-helix protein, CopG family n=1 Tax=Saccharolobus sp. TaxID=2100761 RepID=UPI003160858F
MSSKESLKQTSFKCEYSLFLRLEEEAKKANTTKAAIVRKAVKQLLQHSVDEISELSKKTSPYSGSYVVLIKLPESLVAQLDAIAEKISTSRSNLIRTALASYFKLV